MWALWASRSSGALARILLAEGRESEAARLLGDLLGVLDRRGLLASEKELG